MARITVELPSLLRPLVEGCSNLPVDAATVEGAFVELSRVHPALRPQLFDEAGSLREHVLCFHNGVNTRWADGLSTPLRDGDTLVFLQAVSGG